MEGALRAVGQAFSALGFPDPRLTPNGKLDFRLLRQLAAYTKQDPPPQRVKPIPLAIIGYTAVFCCLANSTYTTAMTNMLLLGFYFLLRPGEYACTQNPEAMPFWLCDVHLLINDRHLHNLTATERDLQQVNFIAIEFTIRKMECRGDLLAWGAQVVHLGALCMR